MGRTPKRTVAKFTQPTTRSATRATAQAPAQASKEASLERGYHSERKPEASTMNDADFPALAPPSPERTVPQRSGKSTPAPDSRAPSGSPLRISDSLSAHAASSPARAGTPKPTVTVDGTEIIYSTAVPPEPVSPAASAGREDFPQNAWTTVAYKSKGKAQAPPPLPALPTLSVSILRASSMSLILLLLSASLRVRIQSSWSLLSSKKF
jgi:hypothetical protein